MKSYEHRFYRDWISAKDLHHFRVKIAESDLFISCDNDLQKLAEMELQNVRGDIESYISRDENFVNVLEPYVLPDHAPLVVKRMASAAAVWNVGPMASVAGIVAQSVGERLLDNCETVIVENGGDIFARMKKPISCTLYAGKNSPFSGKVTFKVDASEGIGICTSSGVVGPSLSFGKADAVVAVSEDTAFADAAATALANEVKSPEDVDRVVDMVSGHGDLKGVIACMGDRIGFWGEIELSRSS